MNQRHLLAIVIAVNLINLGFSYFSKGASVDLTSILHSSLISAFLGFCILLFDLWGWRLPILYPWFVPVPCIRGEWDVEGDVSWVRSKKNKNLKGSIVIEQTFFSIRARIDWNDYGETHFLKKVPIAATEDGLCAFTAIYEIDPKKTDESSAPRRVGVFFRTSDRRPSNVTLYYSTTDNQVGQIRLTNRRKISPWEWLMPK
ncbi:MAG TPA: hypothetical protein VF427_02500 [Noviherbaspirillum sp.]